MKRTLCLAALLVAAVTPWAGAESQNVVARIAFLSDLHFNLKTNDPAAAYNRRAEDAIAAANAAAVDLVLIAGDLTDGGSPEQMDLFKQKVKQLKAPVLFVAGNHDVGHAGTADKPRTITAEKVAAFEKTLGPNYFVQEKAGVRVVGINSCLLGTGLKQEAEQWAFLEKALARPLSKPTILLEHYPLFLKSADEPAKEVWNVPPEPRRRLLGLLKQGGVKTVLSGHLHYPITNRLEGILFLSNVPTAFGLPRGKQEEGWMLLTVPRQGDVQFEFKKLE